jgi:hypothetical protein
MPNWCENTLTVKGPDKTIKSFMRIAKARGSALSMNKFIPMPEELANTRAPTLNNTKRQRERNKRLRVKYGFDNWYEWRYRHWGVKWDVEANMIDHKDGYVAYMFDTAWGPATDWLDAVAKKYPDLRFTLKYEEPGMGFRGCHIVKDNKIIRDSYYVNE